MFTDDHSTDDGSPRAAIYPQASAQPTHRIHRTGPAYQPAFERVELTEIRAPFWGIANHAMHEYYDEQR